MLTVLTGDIQFREQELREKYTPTITQPSHFMWLPWIQVSQRLQSYAGYKFAVNSTKDHIVIATFSDHIYDGIRIAVKQGKADPANIELLCYREDGVIEQVMLDKNGSEFQHTVMNNWFGDQFDLDVNVLAGFGDLSKWPAR